MNLEIMSTPNTCDVCTGIARFLIQTPLEKKYACLDHLAEMIDDFNVPELYVVRVEQIN